MYRQLQHQFFEHDASIVLLTSYNNNHALMHGFPHIWIQIKLLPKVTEKSSLRDTQPEKKYEVCLKNTRTVWIVLSGWFQENPLGVARFVQISRFPIADIFIYR